MCAPSERRANAVPLLLVKSKYREGRLNGRFQAHVLLLLTDVINELCSSDHVIIAESVDKWLDHVLLKILNWGKLHFWNKSPKGIGFRLSLLP